MATSLHPPGALCWFELATTDQAGAKAFYTSLFGWTVVDSPIGANEFYSMFKLDGRDVGAAYTLRPDQREQGVPPHWMVYVAVADADAAAARAQSLGATVLAPPFDVMEHGRMAVLQDPQGAVFSIWQPNQHGGTGVAGVAGTVSWAELSTPDQAAGAKFYSDLFGWKMVSGKDMTPAKPGDYYHIVNGTQMIGGVAPPEQRDPNAPPHWLLYIHVESCAGTTAKAKSLRAMPYVESMDVGTDGVISVIADPQGAVFGIHQAKS
jgi:predicted enzyme related to lactoylglutathione lyase